MLANMKGDRRLLVVLKATVPLVLLSSAVMSMGSGVTCRRDGQLNSGTLAMARA